MKIMLANNLYGEHARGGAEFVVETEAVGLRRRGHEVTVVSAVPIGADTFPDVRVPDLPEGLRNQGIGYLRAENGVGHLTYCPPNTCFYGDLAHRSRLGRLVWHWLDIFNWRSASKFRRIVEACRPDVVHTHNLMGLGFAIPTALRQLGVRHVHTVHDVQLLHPSGLLPTDWRPHWPHEWIDIWLMRAMMGSPATVIFPSEFAMRMHGRFGFFPKSTRVVARNPAVGGVREERDRRGGGTAISARRFMFIGQLEEHKGILDLLEAWGEWTERGDATLDIVGDGSLHDAVRGRSVGSQGVTFHGAVYGGPLNELLNAASWLVVPSRVIENAPMSILMAMSHGVPVLAARSGGIPELVRDGENGFLFEPANTDSLLDSLKRAASRGNISDLSRNALRTVASMNVEAHLDKLAKIYGGHKE